MLDELSIINNNLESISVESHPGIKPLVTGLDNISMSEDMIQILMNNKTNFRSLILELNYFPCS